MPSNRQIVNFAVLINHFTNRISQKYGKFTTQSNGRRDFACQFLTGLWQIVQNLPDDVDLFGNARITSDRSEISAVAC